MEQAAKSGPTEGCSKRKMRLTTFKTIVERLIHPMWQIVFFISPLAMLIFISLSELDEVQGSNAYTFENYRVLVEKPRYRIALWNSVVLSTITAALAVAIALPLVQAVTVGVSKRWRNWLLLVFAIPFFSNFVMRMFAWQIWLSNDGILTTLLRKSLGVDIPGMLYSRFAVLIGELSLLVPVCTILIYLSICRLSSTLTEAAKNLGASSLQVFRMLQLPYAIPGILIGFAVSFAIALGDIVCPSVLGGNNTYLLSSALQDRFRINQWSAAAAIAIEMLLVAVAMLIVIGALLRRLPTIDGRTR